MKNCAGAHTNDPRLVRSKILQKDASKEVSLEHNKTFILLRVAGEGRTYITQTINNLYEKKYPIEKIPGTGELFFKVSPPPPLKGPARGVGNFAQNVSFLGGALM